MNARTSRILIPIAAVVFVASLVGLGVSVTKLFFSSHPQAAVHIAAGGTAPAKALLASSGYRAGTPADSLQNKSQPIAGNNRLNNRVNSGLQYSIFHPPPVVSQHLHGILNSKFSYPVRFIMAMAACPGGQTVAMATEGQGLVMFRPAARPPHRWVQFHPNKDGTGFPSWNTYSVCFDSQGRLWVGTLRKGVMVGYIGRRGWQWRHYDEISRPATAKNPNLPNEGAMTFNGPIGCHVFAIVENPIDHSIWISTEAGISIYYPRSARRKDADLRGAHIAAGSAGGNTAPMLFGRWRYITQANGLPSSPVDCMAFDKTGRIFAGTQCNGIAIANMQDNYQHWRIVPGPDHVTIHAKGKGLPSDLINAVLVTKQSKIYVATDWGLGISDDDGANWHYIRGQNYAAKVAQLWHPPKHWKAPNPQSLSKLLPGDHITCLAQDSKGRIWLGTWRNGYAIYEPGKGVVYHNTLPKGAWRHGGDYVNAILPVHLDEQDSEGIGGPARVVLVGQYGVIAHPRSSGVSLAWEGGNNPARTVNERQPNTRFPAAAMPPTRDQLADMADQLAQAIRTAPKKSPRIVPITDDWRTEGSWLGRYGRFWACLFACGHAPSDLVWRPGAALLAHSESMGPHRFSGDSVRFWIHRPLSSNSQALELPEVYLKNFKFAIRPPAATGGARREAEIDDHGEVYPATWQGPGLKVFLRIPKGDYVLSLYFRNDAGKSGDARDRDAPISLSAAAPTAYRGIAPSREAATDRAADFSCGVWNRFLLHGPMRLVVHISRNYSLNSIVSGAMLDCLPEHPAPYYCGEQEWRRRELHAALLRRKLVASLAGGVWRIHGPLHRRTYRKTASRLLEMLATAQYRAPAAWAAVAAEFYSAILRCRLSPARAGPSVAAVDRMAEECCYRLSLFRRWENVERALGITSSRRIEERLRPGVAGIRGAKILEKIPVIERQIAREHPFGSDRGVAFGLIRWAAERQGEKPADGLWRRDGRPKRAWYPRLARHGGAGHLVGKKGML
jgi:hypothetical protein